MKKNQMLSIYVIGYAGNLGTKLLIENHKEKILAHFNHLYIEKIIEELESDYLSLFKFGENIYDEETVRKGGVLSALWKICERNKIGINFSLRKIPILQSTIEIAEIFSINPYRLLTNNSKIVLVNENMKIDKKEKNEKFIFNNDIKNCNFSNFEIKNNIETNDIENFSFIKKIGETNNKKSRIRIDGETISFLTKDYKDEINKIIKKYI